MKSLILTNPEQDAQPKHPACWCEFLVEIQLLNLIFKLKLYITSFYKCLQYMISSIISRRLRAFVFEKQILKLRSYSRTKTSFLKIKLVFK